MQQAFEVAFKKMLVQLKDQANQNDPEAQLKLGMIYDRGMFVEKDPKAAREPGKSMSILATLPNLTCLNLAHNGVKNEDMVALDPLVKKGTTTICFKKRDSRNPNIIGPHPELFHIGTQ